MKRTTLLFIIACVCFSSVTIVSLFLISDRSHHKNNNFIRLFPPGVAVMIKRMDLKYNSYYIAGGSQNHVYLGNETAARHAIVSNLSLTDTQHVNIKVLDRDKLKLKVVRLSVDSPNFYLLDGISPAILAGTLKDWTAQNHKYDSSFFIEAVPMSPTSYVFKSLYGAPAQYTLGKQRDSQPAQFVPGLLTKQVDGMFCMDGRLHYSKPLNQLVYIYTYRNEYVCMDTALNLKYRGHTIDTTTKAKIKVSKIASDNVFTLASPPLTVNKQSCVSGKWLFVQSNLMARNENEEFYNHASVIDVYDLETRVYKFSFYLDDFAVGKMRQFKVLGDKLVALYGSELVMFELHKKYFADGI